MSLRKFLRRLSSRRLHKLTLVKFQEMFNCPEEEKEMRCQIFWQMYPLLIENKSRRK